MRERNGGEIAKEKSNEIDNQETATSASLNNDPACPNTRSESDRSTDIPESSPSPNRPDAHVVQDNADDDKTLDVTETELKSLEQKIGEGTSGASDVLCEIAEAIFIERFFDASLDEIKLDDISDDATKKRHQQMNGDVGHQKDCTTKETKKFLLQDLRICLRGFCTCMRRQSIQE